MLRPSRRSAWASLRTRLRWSWRRFERRLPESTRRSLPWATSLLAHALALFLLAVVIRFAQPDPPTGVVLEPIGQLRDDVTSLHPGDRPGDSFTTLDSLDPPSLPPDLSRIDETILAVAELPPEVQLGPNLDLTPSVAPGELAASLNPGRFARPASGSLTSPMLGRSRVERARLVRREGGTVESEAAVERGLDWIARHQRADGGWSLDTSNACSQPSCPQRPAMQSDTAATGLALLPLLGAGHTHTQPGRYQQSIARGLAWLLNAQQPDGAFYLHDGGNHAYLYSHAIATMAVCEAYALTQDKRLRAPAQRAVAFIARSQHVLGGWRYQPMTEGDTSVHGWVLFALRSADIAGIPISKRLIRNASRYLDNAAADKIGASYAYQPGRPPTPTMTAEGLVCRQILGWPRETPALLQGSAAVFQHLQQDNDRNIYYWYYATMLLHNMRDKNWKTWNEQIRETLINLQVRGKGCDAGSWDPISPSPDAWGKSAGRLYTTSLSLLTLEVYYRYLPLYRDTSPIDGGDDAAPLTAESSAASP
ncbi:MAG: hypothetical protein KatS3mg108_2752 [Isosphaeraceae bacterium]|jgi:hypothetical protein|nr:MAG: hypothetical protein KatS3mg108_2752 [Isosphaeraceae bacterium]